MIIQLKRNSSDKKDHILLDGSMGMSDYGGVPIKRQRITPPLSERVMLYVRQDNEDVYTALHVVPPTTNGLISAVSVERLPSSRFDCFAFCARSSNIQTQKTHTQMEEKANCFAFRD